MKKLLVISLIMACYLFSSGQSELPKYAPSADKIKVSLDMPLEGRKYKNGTGFSLNPKLLKEMPKKVALVSFYSFDPGMTKKQNWTTSTHYVTKTSAWNAEGSTGEIALGFYGQSIEQMVSDFKEYGMELMMPEQYLNTEEKKKYYEDYKVERAKFNEWIQNMGAGSHNDIFGYIGGYNLIDIVNEPYANYTKTGGRFITKKGAVADKQVWVMDKCGKMVGSLGGDLCSKLEVDAVVIVYFTIYAPKDGQVKLANVNLSMFGPNPTKLEEGKDKKFNYFPGQFYCGTRVSPEIFIWKPHKKDPSTNELDFTGFEHIMTAMVNKMGTYLKEGIEKGKK